MGDVKFMGIFLYNGTVYMEETDVEFSERPSNAFFLLFAAVRHSSCVCTDVAMLIGGSCWILVDQSGLTGYTMNDSPQPHCSSTENH